MAVKSEKDWRLLSELEIVEGRDACRVGIAPPSLGILVTARYLETTRGIAPYKLRWWNQDTRVRVRPDFLTARGSGVKV